MSNNYWLGLNRFSEVNDFLFTSEEHFEAVGQYWGEGTYILSDDFLTNNFAGEQDYKIITIFAKEEYIDSRWGATNYEKGYILQLGDDYYKLGISWEQEHEGDDKTFYFDKNEKYLFFQLIAVEFHTIHGREHLFEKNNTSELIYYHIK